MVPTVLAQSAVKSAPFAKPTRSFAPPSSRLRIISLGGLGEVGKNLMVYETTRSILVVDAGLMFPDKEMLGIDFVIPDTRYLEENRHKIAGIILTHGHEDHIGGVPYIWPRLKAPLYATKLTAGLVELKMQELGIEASKVNLIKPGDILKLGDFQIDIFSMTHSIPGLVGLAIKTALGTILHLADFKFDPNPILGEKTDFESLKKYAAQGVLLLVADSTNIESPGHTKPDVEIFAAIEGVFQKAKGRLIVTSFASRIDRAQMVLDLAVKYNRKVGVSGRSLERNINLAADLGYLKLPQHTLADIRRINSLPDNEVVILATGSQGEEFSALARMASGEHRQIKIKKGDTVALSASAVPGNESSVYEMVDNLYREGAEVIYGKDIDIHTSGHANREELRELLELIKPKYFLPMHGDFRFLVKHAQLAQESGVPKENTIVADNGEVVEVAQGKVYKTTAHVPAGYVLVDGLGVGDVGNIVLRDRQAMAKDGIFVIILTVDRKTGQIITSPDIISRGFVYMRAAEDLIHKARAEVRKMMSTHTRRQSLNWDYIKKMMREELGEFLYQETQRRPMVIPVIIEV